MATVTEDWDCPSPSTRAQKISVMILGTALCAVLMAYVVFGETSEDHGLKSMRMVSILFRHGEKTPSDFYPNDPHKSADWPGGLGALTENGIRQTYKLGQHLRMRYYRLLPPNGLYSKQAMYVVSSAAERCIMSAQSLLAGFSPPLKHYSPLSIPWQPIPVNVLPRNEDTLIAQKKPCSKYDSELQNLYQNPPADIDEMYQTNSELFSLLTALTGKNISTVLDVELLYNTLDIEKSAGLELPDWTKNIFPDRIKPMAERSYTLFTETDFMKQVKGGAFVTEVLREMKRKLKPNLSPDRKIFLYAGHDVTQVNVMNSLRILDQTAKLPAHASALAFELHENPFAENGLEVKIVYYTDSEDVIPTTVNIPNCTAPCSLSKFEESVRHLILDDYDKICENPKVGNCDA